MSPRLWQDRLQDILDAIAEIELFLQGVSADQFSADAKTLKAVIANLTIIGEAANHIPPTISIEHPEVPWGYMRAMRNRMVHAYFHVDPQIVWDTCKEDLPQVVEPLKSMLAQYPPLV